MSRKTWSMLFVLLLLVAHGFVATGSLQAEETLDCDQASNACQVAGCVGGTELCAEYECWDDCWIIWSCLVTKYCNTEA